MRGVPDTLGFPTELQDSVVDDSVDDGGCHVVAEHGSPAGERTLVVMNTKEELEWGIALVGTGGSAPTLLIVLSCFAWPQMTPVLPGSYTVTGVRGCVPGRWLRCVSRRRAS
jgi:hypothetical protein